MSPELGFFRKKDESLQKQINDMEARMSALEQELYSAKDQID